MAELVSGWVDDDRVILVQRLDGDIRYRAIRAPWALYVSGLDDHDRAVIARDRRVTGVRVEARGGHARGYTRIDCRNRWARKEIHEILERAIQRGNTGNGAAEILEADVSPLRRVLSDIGSLDIHPDPRLGFFDLETDSRKTFAQAKEGQARILSWALCGADGFEASGLLEADTDAAEKALIKAFFQAASRFDVLLAWNGDGFDFPVIDMRCQSLDLELRWHRWCWLDHLQVFKKYNMHSDDSGEAKQSFKLDHVARYLLGEGKDDFDASKTWEAWEAGGESRARLLRYNIKDTRLLPRIEAKTGFLSLHLAVCHICRIFPDTQSLNATQQGDGFLIRLGTTHGYRWPTRRQFDENEHRKFAGAFVMDPTRLGAIDNVHVCDFAGLYPSIIRTWNMSPDTKVQGQGPAEDDPEFWDKTWKEGAAPRVRDGICQLPKRATWFRTDRNGMFRIALDHLVAKRAEYTNAMKAETPGSPEHVRFKRLSGAFKIVANSFYGILGSPWSRFFDSEIAEGVTQTGKWLLQEVIAEAKVQGLDPFYGDTDSAFVQGEAETMRRLVDDLNRRWREKVAPWGIRDEMPCHIDLDFEKTFRRIVVVSAKRYAGAYARYKGKDADENTPPEVKGLEFKRGDTIRLAREMQSEVVGLLLKPGPLPPASSARELIERWRIRVLQGDLTLEDVLISQSLSKRVEDYVERYSSPHCTKQGCGNFLGGTEPGTPETCPKCNQVRAKVTVPAHVRVAKILQERGEPVGEGARVSYVIVATGDNGRVEAIPASDPDAVGRADRLYYWENRVYPATARILERVYPGESWGESKGDRKQRVQEMNGQGRLDFSGSVSPVRHEAAALAPLVGKVRRRKVQPGVLITIFENNPSEDGAAEGHRRDLQVRALRTAIEAHPGNLPVTVRVTWRSPFKDGEPIQTKVNVALGVSIADTPEARRALDRVIRAPNSVAWPMIRT